MEIRFEIPESFWGLFRSVNREVYIESLLCINEEYQYSNYFLTKEMCIQLLSDMNAKKNINFVREDDESETDLLDTTAARILQRLLKAGWLKKIEDYQTMTSNIVIPDYAAVFIEAFERLTTEDLEETEMYIQNVYATLFSFRNNPRVNLNMLRTALINTRKLNKALQDMLHNMDRFFERLLAKETYSELLKEHLSGYVEEVVKKKYHILKTSDNFYIYKMDIKQCLKDMRNDEEWIEAIRKKAEKGGDKKDDVLDLLDMIERGFDDIEHRISNMDREHSKYVRATVARLNYLLSAETDTKGMIVQLLRCIAASNDRDAVLKAAADKMNLSMPVILSEKSLYKRRKPRRDFISQMEVQQETEDLNREDILRLNRIQKRYSKEEIEEFIDVNMKNGIMDTENLENITDRDFEKLILAYDYSTRKNSRYRVAEESGRIIEKGRFRYPAMKFIQRRPTG